MGDLPLVLELLAALDVFLGRFGSATANPAEGMRLAVETGQATNTS